MEVQRRYDILFIKSFCFFNCLFAFFLFLLFFLGGGDFSGFFLCTLCFNRFILFAFFIYPFFLLLCWLLWFVLFGFVIFIDLHYFLLFFIISNDNNVTNKQYIVRFSGCFLILMKVTWDIRYAPLLLAVLQYVSDQLGMYRFCTNRPCYNKMLPAAISLVYLKFTRWKG